MDSHEVIKTWVVSFTDGLYLRACTAVSDKSIAEDLVQETFISAYQSFDTFRSESSPRTWLFAILNNKINDHFRSKQRVPVVSKELEFFGYFFDEYGHWRTAECPQHWSEADDHLLDNGEFRNTLQKCRGNLPEHWNMVLLLKYIDQRDGKEICQDLNISPSNFWQLMHRAKLQLRKCLEVHWFNK